MRPTDLGSLNFFPCQHNGSELPQPCSDWKYALLRLESFFSSPIDTGLCWNKSRSSIG